MSEAADPMTEFARAADKTARQAREKMEEQDEAANIAYAEIAKAKLGIEGARFAPDATFTIRLSYGTVEGYEEDGNRSQPSRNSPDCISGPSNTTIVCHSKCRANG